MYNTRPKNYLIESILVTIFCCLPFGIVGIVYAADVNSKYEMGDIEGATRASENAKKWMTWGIISSVILAVLYFLLFAALGIAFLSFDNF